MSQSASSQMATPKHGTQVGGNGSGNGSGNGNTARGGFGETSPAFEEVLGDPSIGLPAPQGGSGVGETAEAEAFTEVGAEAAQEADAEFIEATPSQLAAARAESGEEGAFSDLRGIEGFEAPETGADAEGAPLYEAGTVAEGDQAEFLPILASLVPMLVSAAGPAIASAIGNRLSQRTRRRVQKVAGTVAAAGASAIRRGGRRQSGPANLLPILARLLLQKATETGGSESGEAGAVDEAFVAEAATAMEVILGIDQRVRITQTDSQHWRRVCALRIQFPSGATYRGTGFLIGPRSVATAGHCVYMRRQGGWARQIVVMPGANGLQRPYGQAVATSYRSFAGWVNNGLAAADVGCIFLAPGAFSGYNLGHFGVAAFSPQELVAQQAVVAGYPGDKPEAELWGMADYIKAVSARTVVYNHDTVGGQSGAPVYIKRGGKRYVVAIHNYGASTGNSATRVTPPVQQRLQAWALQGTGASAARTGVAQTPASASSSQGPASASSSYGGVTQTPAAAF